MLGGKASGGVRLEHWNAVECVSETSLETRGRWRARDATLKKIRNKEQLWTYAPVTMLCHTNETSHGQAHDGRASEMTAELRAGAREYAPNSVENSVGV